MAFSMLIRLRVNIDIRRFFIPRGGRPRGAEGRLPPHYTGTLSFPCVFKFPL